MAICKAFFEEDQSQNYDEKELSHLKRSLLEFVEICKEALDRNREIISNAELAFHEQMVSSYQEMKETMHRILL